jgi:transposase, IS5 family
MVLRETDPQTTIWELLLPEEAKRLPAELQAVDAYLDDERFIAPWRALFDRRLGRPSVPIDTLLRLLHLKHRYGLGYESLCREVADSLSWRCCRIPLDRPVPHPTTLVKLVRRAGPQVIKQLNAALPGKLCEDKLLRGRKLRVDTTVVEADIDYPTDADLLEHAVRKLGGLVRRIKAHDAASRTRFRDRGRAAGRRMQAAGPQPAAAHRGGSGGGGPAHRPGRPDRAAHPAGRAGGSAHRPPGTCPPAW